MQQPAFRLQNPADTTALSSALVDALEGLVSEDFQRQWEAAKQIKRIGAPAIAPLVELAQDDTIDEDIRWFAARTLGEFDHPQAIAALAKLLNSEEEDLNQMAAAALAQIGTSAIHPLSYLLQSEPTRLLAVQALAQIRQRGIISPLLRVVNDKNPQVRQAAIEALGSFQDPRILPVLRQGLRDPVADIRQESVAAIGLRLQRTARLAAHKSDESHQVGRQVIACLYDIDLRVCAKAALALGRWGTPEALENLAIALEKPDTPELLKVQLIRALGRISAPKAVAAIAGALVSPETTVRQAAIRTLAMVDPPLQQQATALLSQHLIHQLTAADKQAIALALAQLKGDGAFEGIMICLADLDESVQLHAIAALKQLDATGSYEVLQRLNQSASTDPQLKSSVQKALSEW